MSDIQDLRGNIELKKIEAPSLTQSNYGKNIREKFDNIDDNLRRLSNRDFVAGKAGKDIKFAKYSLWSDGDFTDLGRVFVQAIVGDELIDWDHDWNASVLDFTEEFYDNHKILSPVSVQNDSKVKFFEYFIENPDITIMYQLNDHEAPDEEANRILICSPYVYTFIDQRYAVLGTYVPDNPNVYSELEDTSCLLNLTYDGENPQLERINQFPTLYYDGNGQFRWKLYGSESGILATGPKGDSALSAPITFARLISSSTEDNTATGLSSSIISQILVINGSTAQWTDVTAIDEDKLPKVGDPIVAYRPMTPQESQDPALIGQPYTVYFTKVIDVVGRVISVCDASSTSIQFLVSSTMLDSMLKTIREGSMGTSCLYVPSIGRLDDFDSNSIVHAAIGTQATESGIPHYYLTLKPIAYSEVTNPEDASAVDNSKLIIDYNDVEVKGDVEVKSDVEVKGNTKLLHDLNVSGSVSISGILTTSSLTSIAAKITNTLKVGTTSRGVEIGGMNKDSITLYKSSADSTKKTILTSESITTSSVTASESVTANNINANAEVNTKLLTTNNDKLTITSGGSVKIDKPLTVDGSTIINRGAIINGGAKIVNGIDATNGPAYISPKFAYSNGTPETTTWDSIGLSTDVNRNVFVPKQAYPAMWLESKDDTRIFAFPADIYTSDSIVFVHCIGGKYHRCRLLLGANDTDWYEGDKIVWLGSDTFKQGDRKRECRSILYVAGI